MAKVVSINISEKKGVSKTPISDGEFIVGFGLKGDAHGGDWHRQVSLLPVESIEKMIKMGAEDLTEGSFAENITTQGLEVYSLPIGTKLKINDLVLEMTQIGKECHQKCAIYNKLKDCIMPKEGVFAKVLIGGIIKPGDEIIILE